MSDSTAAALEEVLAPLTLEERLAHVAAHIAGRKVFTTSFGIEDQVITHAIFTQDLPIDVVTLDTGHLFPETHAVWAETERLYRRRIRSYIPNNLSVEAMLLDQGALGFRNSIENRKQCCFVRKVEPLGRALNDAAVWITGLRADQSGNRTGMHFATYEDGYKLLKVNPLLDWTRARAAAFASDNAVPVNVLHDRGMLSIGCAPCTRAIAPGEPERAGRWWWEDEGKKECGLHVGGGRLNPPVKSSF